MPQKLNSRQTIHLLWAKSRIEGVTSNLLPNIWDDSDSADAIGEARLHLQQAYDLLQEITCQPAVDFPARAMPQTTDEFLSMPLMQHPAMSARLCNILWGLSKESTQSNHTDFSAQNLLDNGLTINRFKQCRGTGKKMITDLTNLFGTYGVSIPLC